MAVPVAGAAGDQGRGVICAMAARNRRASDKSLILNCRKFDTPQPIEIYSRRKFGSHVLRDIDQIIEKAGGPILGGLVFQCFTAFDERANRDIRSFEMTRDGFTLLAMGFTGEKALHW
jgi:hypothetical protein